MLLALNPLDAHSWLDTAGPLAVLLVMFAETGLLIGFFLPGDSLLFTAGTLCATSAGSTGHLPLWPTLICAAAGALLGAQTGYLLGKHGGRPMIERGHPKLREGVERTEGFLERYGVAKALVLSRFVPIVRTVISPLAGMGDMPARTFLVWQCLGGLLWSVGVTLLGYGLGSSIDDVDRYLLPIIALVVLISLIPVLLEVRRSRSRRRAAS
jgi:membrane-associated protein